jgi:hypothetical protein
LHSNLSFQINIKKCIKGRGKEVEKRQEIGYNAFYKRDVLSQLKV